MWSHSHVFFIKKLQKLWRKDRGDFRSHFRGGNCTYRWEEVYVQSMDAIRVTQLREATSRFPCKQSVYFSVFVASSYYCWSHLTFIQKQGPVGVAGAFMEGFMQWEGLQWALDEWESLQGAGIAKENKAHGCQAVGLRRSVWCPEGQEALTWS